MRVKVAVLAAALWLTACRGERAPQADSTRPRTIAGCASDPWSVAGAGGGSGAGSGAASSGSRPVMLVQVGSFADSTRAAALQDSLRRAGWTTRASRVTNSGRALTRVSLLPLQGADMPRLVAYALRKRGHAAVLVKDLVETSTPAVRVLPVNRGTHGMAASTRWAASPDGCALLVEEDPTAVEAEAVPNGFLYASDVGPLVLQQDNVWDVAPSPGWSHIAYGRAYVVHAGERDSVLPAQWDSLAALTGLPADSVRRGAFISSGMAIAFGFSLPVVVDLRQPVRDSASASRTRTARLPGGWRVGWTKAGDFVAVGASPQYVQDDTPSPSWLGLDPVTLAPRGALAADALASPSWVEGPVLDVSIPLDSVTAPAISIDGYTIGSAGGWIRIEPTDGRSAARIVGPGIALAATRSGQFIAALVPWPDAGQYDQPARLVVYQVTP